MAPKRKNERKISGLGDNCLQIVLAIDWGTSQWSAATDIYQNGCSIRGPAPLLIDDLAYEIPMMATWTGPDGGEFVHGLKLQESADGDKWLSDRIITFFKLGLYGELGSEVTKRNERILSELPGKRSLDSLITAHLRAIVHDCKAAIRVSDDLIDLLEADVEEALKTLHVRITVPAIWTPDARRRMQHAARKAGLEVVVLASEPQCALSYLMHKIANKTLAQRGLVRGDHILVADLGCGTGDFVMFQLQEKLAVNSVRG